VVLGLNDERKYVCTIKIRYRSSITNETVQSLVRKLEGISSLETAVDRRLILKRTLEKYCVSMWTRLI
jgi:hypothetical protein